MQTSAPLKLSQLNQLIQYAIDGVFREQTYAVIAETSNIKNYQDKRQCYLTLVEKAEHSNEVLASIQAKIWGNVTTPSGILRKPPARFLKITLKFYSGSGSNTIFTTALRC